MKIVIQFLSILLLSALTIVQTVNAADNSPTDSPLYNYDEEESNLDYLDNTPDPLEPLNRVVFRFNQLFDGLVLKPLATIVSTVVPEPGQHGIRNFIDNLFTPISMINCILQGDIEEFASNMFRFIINTTIGIGGLFDVAQEMGLNKKLTSFNETLAVWGVESGPYLVLPILGPSSFRDLSGKVGDYYGNPLYILAQNKHRAHNHHLQQMNQLRALYALDGIMFRTEYLKVLNDIEKSSIDFYVALRSYYFQKQKPLGIKRQKTKME